VREAESARGPSAGPPLREFAYVAGAAVIFATSGPVAKGITSVQPIAVACARTGLAALALLLLDGASIVRAWREAPRSVVRRALVAGLLLAAHFAAYLVGLANTSLAAASALVAIEPIAVLAVASIAQGLHPRPGELVGVLVATLGAFVVGSAAGVGEHRLDGDLLVVLAVFLYGLYVAVARGVGAAVPSRAYAAFVYGTASLALAPIFAFSAAAHELPSSGDALRVLALALLPTLVGHTIVQRAASRVRPSVLALVSPGESVGSITLGACMLHVWPSPREWVGIAVVLAGTTFAALGARGR
jgi:drug/metabolite transporter (DMT)-like permease